MSNDTFDLVLLAVMVAAFIAGYKIIGAVVTKLKARREAENPASLPFAASGAGDIEAKYAAALELDASATPEEIRRQYYTLLDTYHPNKFRHLDQATQDAAARETEKIMAAYGYFKKKYGIR